MRSHVTPTRPDVLRPGRPGSRLALSAAALLSASVSLCAASASAEEVLPPPPVVDQAAPAQPAQTTTTTTVTTTTAPPAVAPPAAPPAVAAPAAPQPPALPPPPPGAAGPIYYNGPVWVIPAPVTAQPVPPPVALPPAALPPPPVFYQPGYRPRTARCCASPAMLRRAEPRGPMFSIGARFTTFGVNQEVFGQGLNMMGGGLDLRFRNQGHWGFETSFDILRANVGDGAFVRMSYPWTAGVMLYLFRNRPENHFNIYGVAGVGLMADDVTLYQGSRQERNQQFLEVMAHAGGGVELRFKHLALTADVRALALMLDTTGPAGSFYDGVDGGPIPQSSVGYKANFGARVWF